MSLPRAVIPGRRYLITRRCSERRFLLRPGRETNNAFVDCMALAARKAGVSVVCLGTTSNHHHAVVLDNRDGLPEFLEHFHKLFAKHQNCLRGRWEAFWASEPASIVELPNAEDVLAKLVYAITARAVRASRVGTTLECEAGSGGPALSPSPHLLGLHAWERSKGATF